ncbi:MAG: DUF2251 domain-containing protein [Planctomycetes bacterium]|nr:DUF2251 domain-containing protein [Planctomycetota bacterium]
MHHPHLLHALVHAGSESFLALESPDRNGGWSLVFEDDGDSGYAYACRMDGHGPGSARIVESKLVYVVDRDVERDAALSIELVWDDDGRRAGVVIGNRLSAAFDFCASAAWSRTGFPECCDGWNELPASVCDEVERWFERVRAR